MFIHHPDTSSKKKCGTVFELVHTVSKLPLYIKTSFEARLLKVPNPFLTRYDWRILEAYRILDHLYVYLNINIYVYTTTVVLENPTDPRCCPIGSTPQFPPVPTKRLGLGEGNRGLGYLFRRLG